MSKKTNTILIIAAGLGVGYLLAPREVKSAVGGAIPGAIGIDLGGLIGDITLPGGGPSIPSINIPGGGDGFGIDELGGFTDSIFDFLSGLAGGAIGAVGDTAGAIVGEGDNIFKQIGQAQLANAARLNDVSKLTLDTAKTDAETSDFIALYNADAILYNEEAKLRAADRFTEQRKETWGPLNLLPGLAEDMFKFFWSIGGTTKKKSITRVPDDE